MKENICFADRGNKCLAVLHKQCKGCNFYKTHEEARISRKMQRKGLNLWTRLQGLAWLKNMAQRGLCR